MKKWMGMEPDDLLCSRNARPQMDAREQADRSSCSQSHHDKTVVARCAQCKINAIKFDRILYESHGLKITL